MKKMILLILVGATVLTSCKNADKQAENNSTELGAPEQTNAVLSTEWRNEIQLDNGAKWAANIETTDGVEKMNSLLQTHATSTLAEYHQLAGGLNDIKNKVVKECSMKGSSHDNLHVWLMPVIAKVDALSKAETIESAETIKRSIEDSTKAYVDYFN